MAVEFLLGVGIVVAFFFLLFDRLDAKKHFVLRLLILFLNVTFVLLVPLFLLGVSVVNIFYKLYLAWTFLFWAYVTTALFVWVMRKWGLIMPKKFRGDKV